MEERRRTTPLEEIKCGNKWNFNWRNIFPVLIIIIITPSHNGKIMLSEMYKISALPLEMYLRQVIWPSGLSALCQNQNQIILYSPASSKQRMSNILHGVQATVLGTAPKPKPNHKTNERAQVKRWSIQLKIVRWRGRKLQGNVLLD